MKGWLTKRKKLITPPTPEESADALVHISTYLKATMALQDTYGVGLPPGWITTPVKLQLAHGKAFKIAEDSYSIPKGAMKMCYMNSGKLAEEFPELIYVEGYVIPAFAPIVIAHAWLVDRDGVVYDPTLRMPAKAYFGVPVKTDYLTKTVARTGMWGIMNPEINEQIYKDDPALFLARGLDKRW